MRNPWKKSGDRRDPGGFIALPKSALYSRAYIRAGAHARMLLIDLAAQYNGHNNGDFCAAWKIMRNRGWKSEDTLARAKKELLDLGLIVETRKGARPNRASLYAVTWWALDPCEGKLDISPAAFPRGAYKSLDRVPPLAARENRSLTTPAVAGSRR